MQNYVNMKKQHKIKSIPTGLVSFTFDLYDRRIVSSEYNKTNQIFSILLTENTIFKVMEKK